MTDRRAAESAGLNPDTAAYTKSKPRVRAYMLEHRASVNEQLVDEDVEKQRRLNQTRERLLARLWEIADLEPEKTRGNMSSQVKALSLIATIEGLTPDRRAGSAQTKPAHPPVTAEHARMEAGPPLTSQQQRTNRFTQKSPKSIEFYRILERRFRP